MKKQTKDDKKRIGPIIIKGDMAIMINSKDNENREKEKILNTKKNKIKGRTRKGKRVKRK